LDPEPNILSLATQSYWDQTNIIALLVLVLLIFCSALISGSEVAFFGLSKTELDELVETNTSRAKLVVQLQEKPKKLLASILIANNAINIAIVLLFSLLMDGLFEEDQLLLNIIDLKFFVEVFAVTFLILMFGEILPKVYANRNRKRFALLMVYPLKLADVIFAPLSLPMRSISLFLHKRFGKQKSNISVDHLSQALELTSHGDTTDEEQKILQGIVSFGNTDTKQVMRPRMDIFGLSEELKFLEVLKEITGHGFSRVPVYKENIDHVIGVLYIKDLLPFLDRKQFNWLELIREPYFVPENKKLDDLLKEFQEMKNHLAVVVDEFGGTSGIVTLEDIIEEIVGDISDEFDDEDLIYSKLDDHTYVFEGKTALKDFYKVIGLEDERLFEEEKGESETIAGFVLEQSKSFPKRSDVIRFEGFQFKVESLDKRRIKQIKVSIPKDV
jgi:putative hemolysin